MLNYDPDTGVFTWKHNVSNVKKGTEAGSITKKGYINIRFSRKQCLAHRLAWLFMTGKWPDGMVDHINTIKTDNRWSNLRLATNSENLLNRGKNSNNMSGFKGVSIERRSGKYVASLGVMGKQKYLGRFSCPKEAHRAYVKAITDASPEFARF